MRLLPDGWWHSTVNIGECMMLGGQRSETADLSVAPWWATDGIKRWPGAGILQNLTGDGAWKEFGRLATEEVRLAKKDDDGD
eukprot:gene13449-13614_t